MLPINKIKEIISRYEFLEKTLSQSDIDKNTYVKNSKEYASIGDIIEDVKLYVKAIEDKKSLENFLNQVLENLLPSFQIFLVPPSFH